MFQLFIRQSSYSGDFDSKDALISYLEKENAKCIAEELTAVCRILHVDAEGDILEKIDVTLPIFEGQTMDEVLMTFGNQKQKKLPLPSKAKTPTPKPSPKVEQPVPVETVKTSKNPFLFIAMLLALVGIGLGVLAFVRIQSQEQVITQLAQRLEEEQELTSMSRKLDVFCRYFIPNYFSGNTSALDNFRQEGDWSAQTGTVQSVILESTSPTKKGYEVGYVINVNREGTISRHYLQLEIVKDEKGTFGFSVDKEPMLSDYPTKE
ncbi:hypothetical protein [Streptococcus suis]|uniref:hypothetical protein n=1 Tax=Streptococcus suis TaxID=1307 RepID=UPI00041E5733|nr:hypothetical protein [Streptococcus suis]